MLTYGLVCAAVGYAVLYYAYPQFAAFVGKPARPQTEGDWWSNFVWFIAIYIAYRHTQKEQSLVNEELWERLEDLETQVRELREK